MTWQSCLLVNFILTLWIATVPAKGVEAVTRAFAKIIDEVNTLELDELQRR